MNNNYLKFNEWAFDYYKFKNSYARIGTLAIEVTEIENYCKKYNCNLKFHEIIDQDWSKLLNSTDNSNPKYFGLIALQCYAASLMENDDDNKIGVNDYQTRFIEVSGIRSTQELQIKFRSKFMGIPIQERIWIEAKKFLSNINIEIYIPNQSNNANRYVKYPKKQVVLNQEDLNEYCAFFLMVKSIFDGLSFNDFAIFFKNHINKYDFKRKNNLKNDLSKNESNIKLKQIFDFYCSENWKVRTESLRVNKINKEEPKYILYYNKSAETKIQLFNDNYDPITFPTVMFQKSQIIGVVFFKKSDEYENEFDFVSYLENDAEYILVANNTSNPNDLKILSECFESINFDRDKFYFFIGKINLHSLPSEFTELISEPYPLKLVGVKISRKNHYLIHFPPKIININNKDYRIYPEYNINDVKLGNYLIKVPGYSNLNFEIIDNPNIKEIVHPKKLGLKINILNIVEDQYDVQGLHFCENQKLKEESLNINQWMSIQIGKTKKIETSNIILKVMTQSNYGK